MEIRFMEHEIKLLRQIITVAIDWYKISPMDYIRMCVRKDLERVRELNPQLECWDDSHINCCDSEVVHNPYE